MTDDDVRKVPNILARMKANLHHLVNAPENGFIRKQALEELVRILAELEIHRLEEIDT